MSSGAALIILWEAIQASSASSTQMEGNRPVWINLVMEFRHSGGRRTTQRKGLLSNWFSVIGRSEEHPSELQSLMRISYDVFCLKKKTKIEMHKKTHDNTLTNTH